MGAWWLHFLLCLCIGDVAMHSGLCVSCCNGSCIDLSLVSLLAMWQSVMQGQCCNFNQSAWICQQQGQKMYTAVFRRIGRTGRCGKTGIATTFINKNQSESILLDLKHLLKEAKQRIPPVLTALEDPYENMEKLAAASGQKGCIFCGGLGHRIGDCPKLASQNRETQRKSKDHFGAKGGMGAEM